MVKERKLISISLEAFEKCNKQYKKEQPKEMVSFPEWISDQLIMNLEKDEFLSKYAPFIEKIGITDNRIVLKDSKLNKYTEIFLKNNILQCSLDETTNCIHTQFALALPECSKLEMKK